MQHYKSKTTGSKDQKKKVTVAQVFKTIIWPRRNLVFIGLILIVLSRLSSLVLPWKSKALLDDVIPNKDYQQLDRKSTRLNSSHVRISYAVFCLKKKKNKTTKLV